MIVRLSDLENVEKYYEMLCHELERMNLDDDVIDVAESYLAFEMGIHLYESKENV